MFSTDFIFRQQENLVDNQKCQAGFRPLCNKVPFLRVQIKRLIILCALVFSLKAKDNFIKRDLSEGSFPGISLNVVNLIIF